MPILEWLGLKLERDGKEVDGATEKERRPRAGFDWRAQKQGQSV